jgi:ParB/RepB/Spo0J family partition protein
MKSKLFQLIPSTAKRNLAYLKTSDIILNNDFLGDDNRPRKKNESVEAYEKRIELDKLAASIHSSGQRTPGLVKPTSGSKYNLIYGFRRYHACKKLGIDFWAEVVSKAISRQEMLSATLSENAHRRDLNNGDLARRLYRCHVKEGIPKDKLAIDCGFPLITVSSLIKAAKMPELLSALYQDHFSLYQLQDLMVNYHYDKFSSKQRERVSVAFKKGRSDGGKLRNSYIRHVVERVGAKKSLSSLKSNTRLSRIFRQPSGAWMLQSCYKPAKAFKSLGDKKALIKDLAIFLRAVRSTPVEAS